MFSCCTVEFLHFPGLYPTHYYKVGEYDGIYKDHSLRLQGPLSSLPHVEDRVGGPGGDVEVSSAVKVTPE